MASDFDLVSAEIEALDKQIRTDGLPNWLRMKWGVETNVGTWSVPRSTAQFLRQLVLIKQPKAILELGTSIGYSTIWLASGAKEVGGEVVTIEKEAYKTETADEYILRAGVADAVRQIQGDIGEVLGGWEEPVDFLFIDANKRGYLKYLKQLEAHLAPNAVVVADNAIDMAEQMRDYLDYFKENEQYSSYLLEIDHGLMISIKK